MNFHEFYPNLYTHAHTYTLLIDRVKQKIEEYEYDEAMEGSYRSSLFKMFNKTLSDGFFPLIVVDATNHKVRSNSRQFLTHSTLNGAQIMSLVYLM